MRPLGEFGERSKAPLFTFPAWRQTMPGPWILGKASERIRPWLSTGTRMSPARPKPRSERAFTRLT